MIESPPIGESLSDGGAEPSSEISGDPPPEISAPVPDARFLDHLSSAADMVAARRFAEAEIEVVRALSIASSDLRALKLLGLIRFKMGRFEEARTACRAIAVALPLDAGIRLKLGLIALKLDQVDEGVRELELSARLAPDDLRPWTYLGFAYARRGERGRAAAAFRRAGDETHAAELERDQAALADSAAQSESEGESDSGREWVTDASTLAGQNAHAFESRIAPTFETSVPAAVFEPAFDLSVPADGLSVPTEGPFASRAARQPRFDPEPPFGKAAGAGFGSVKVAPLVGYAVSRLEPSAHEAAWVGGTARLPVGDEIFVRADAAVACTGNAHWEAAHRRVRGRATTDRLGGSGGEDGQQFLRVTGGGDLFVGAPGGRLVPLLLQDDILYVREDRVLAFEGSVPWEYGHVPWGRVRMLQFRGSGLVAIRVDGEPGALKVTPERPLFVSRPHLVGWIGRVVARGIGQASPGEGDGHGNPSPSPSDPGSPTALSGTPVGVAQADAAATGSETVPVTAAFAVPFGISCEGEGVVLIDVRGRGRDVS